MSGSVSIRDILALNGNHVKIKDPVELERKINILIADGHESLQVVADFDCTLTKQRADEGCKLLTSYGMFGECPSVPQDYKQQDAVLCNYYKPIEMDPALSIPVRAQHMVDWYQKGNLLLRGIHYPADEMEAVAKKVVGNLRTGVCQMFERLAAANVPVLVFSAGLGDAVVCVLTNADILTDNVKVISNFLKISPEGVVEGMQGEVIHVFNKNETVIKGTEYYSLIQQRSNVILLGDSVGDAGMADGMQHHAAIRIGFLFHNIQDNLPHYMDAFDIVLVDDQTVDVPAAILNLVLPKSNLM